MNTIHELIDLQEILYTALWAVGGVALSIALAVGFHTYFYKRKDVSAPAKPSDDCISSISSNCDSCDD